MSLTILDARSGATVGVDVLTAELPIYLADTTALAKQYNVYVPAGAAVGDLLVIAAAAHSATPTAPAGWSTLGTIAAATHRAALFYKVAESGDVSGGQYAQIASIAGASYYRTAMFAYRGAATSSPVDGTCQTAGGTYSTSAITVSAVTPSQAPGSFIRVCMTHDSSGLALVSDEWASSTGWTDDYTSTEIDNGWCFVDSKPYTDTSSSGTQATSTPSTTLYYFGFLFAVKKAA